MLLGLDKLQFGNTIINPGRKPFHCAVCAGMHSVQFDAIIFQSFM